MRSLLGLAMALFPAPQDSDSPPHLAGRVVNAFSDGPVTLLTIAPRSAFRSDGRAGSGIYLRKATDVVWQGVPRNQRTPAPGLYVSIWLLKGTRDTAARAVFRLEEKKKTSPVVRLEGSEVTLEVESFELEGLESRTLAGASGGKAVFFGQGRASKELRLARGVYEVEVHLQSESDQHDAVYFNFDRQEYRFYQNSWGRLSPARIWGAYPPLVNVERDGVYRLALETAETRVLVDRVVLARVEASAPFRPTAEGFIRDWLVLAPIPSEREQDGALELGLRPIGEESDLRPRAGELRNTRRVSVSWRLVRTPGRFLDLRAFALAEAAPWEDVVGYAVCSVWAEEEMKDLELRVGSNDQAKVWLNGRVVVQFTSTRTLEADPSVARGVALRKGENLIVFKIANEKNNWGGCLRFVRADGRPVTKLKVGVPAR